MHRRATRSTGLVVLLSASLSLSCVPSRTYTSVVEPTESLLDAFELLPGRAFPTDAQLLSGNAESWAARWRVLDSATETLDVAYFIVEDDPFGMALLGHLFKKAREGVRVRLLMDARGSGGIATPFMGRDVLQELVATGNADVRIYNPPLPRVTDAVVSLSLVPTIASNHDKILIADKRRAILGGRNISTLYFVHPNELPTATLDADMLLVGDDCVADLHELFLDEFYAKRTEVIGPDAVNFDRQADELLLHYRAMDAFLRGRPEGLPLDGNAAVLLEAEANTTLDRAPPWVVRTRVRRYLDELARYRSLYGTLDDDAGPRHPARVSLLRSGSRASEFTLDVASGVLQALAGARERVSIQTPYFILTWDMLDTLEDLAQRGVQITVLTNSPRSSDNAASQAFFIEEWPEIMARVPTLRIFVLASEQLMHAKRIVLDDELTLLGTFNFDPLSARVNSEVVAAVWSRGFAAENLHEMDARLSGHDVFEYTIARDERGRAIRYPEGHPREGRVVVGFGPRDHTSDAEIEQLMLLKDSLSVLQGFLDFQPVVF